MTTMAAYYGLGIKAPPYLVEPADSFINTNSQTVYTFSNQALGELPKPGEKREIIITVIGGSSSSGSRVVSGVTVGGIAATELVSHRFGSGFSIYAGIWKAEVPEGTSGDVIVTFNGTSASCSGAVLRMTYDKRFNTNTDETDTHASGGGTTRTITFDARENSWSVCLGRLNGFSSMTGADPILDFVTDNRAEGTRFHEAAQSDHQIQAVAESSGNNLFVGVNISLVS